MRVERHGGYWLVVGLAAPGAAATTIGSVIFMKGRAVGNERLLRHELEHVRQWHEQGFVGFLLRYLGSYLRWRLRRYPHWAAYRRIPFEAAAEWVARRTGPSSVAPRATPGSAGSDAAAGLSPAAGAVPG